jgi:hypothetical protein
MSVCRLYPVSMRRDSQSAWDRWQRSFWFDVRQRAFCFPHDPPHHQRRRFRSAYRHLEALARRLDDLAAEYSDPRFTEAAARLTVAAQRCVRLWWLIHTGQHDAARTAAGDWKRWLDAVDRVY